MKGAFEKLMQLYWVAIVFLVLFCFTIVLAAKFYFVLGKVALVVLLLIALRVVWHFTRGYR